MILRVLFVDDEVAMLRGLQRALRPQRDRIEVAVADGWPAAEAILAAAPIDIVVSDMRMPMTSGVELLGRVKERWPGAVRVMLSGQVDRQDVRDILGVAHRFLHKPCNGAALATVVTRVQAIRELLPDPRLRALVGSVGSLPAPREAGQALAAALADPRPDAAAIVRIIAPHVALCARIYQMASCGLIEAAHPPANLEEAVGMLGPALLAAPVDIDETAVVPAPRPDRLAAAARAAETADASERPFAYAAELLSDIGSAVLGARPSEEHPGAAPDAVGAYLLGLWNLPVAAVDRIAHLHAA
jgi:DNA-binding NarL/FixJ family response regulator